MTPRTTGTQTAIVLWALALAVLLSLSAMLNVSCAVIAWTAAQFGPKAKIAAEYEPPKGRKILVFVLGVVSLVVVLGSIMYLVEGQDSGFTSIPRSVYWAIVTLTTVGYGDISPQTDLVPYSFGEGYNPETYRYCAGYQYGDSVIHGFSHTHFSGTGHSDLGDVSLMPVAAAPDLRAGHPAVSRFRHATERAEAGYRPAPGFLARQMAA